MALFEHENECVCSYTISVVFAVILLTISIEIGTYFVCFRWLLMLSLVPELKRQFDKCNSMELNNGKSKKIEIKNRTYYFYNDMIYLKNLESNLLEIYKKHYKEINIYYIGYITIKKNW